jgi:hypothetical protein
MGRDLVSIGKEPLLLSPPIYSDKKRESSVVGYCYPYFMIYKYGLKHTYTDNNEVKFISEGFN